MATTRRPQTAKTKGKAAAKKPAAAGRSGPRPSASKQILGDLGVTDAELHAYLPANAPKWVRAVFWCQFECPRGLDELAKHFGERFTVSLVDSTKSPPGAPPGGVPVRMLIVTPKGKYVAYTFYGMRGDRYVEDGSLQLEVSFREMGTLWGSNRAVYERFKALELPPLGARNVVERTE